MRLQQSKTRFNIPTEKTFMSGILLPGQENRPPQGDDSPAGGEDSGLILPKGYSSKQAEAPKPVEAQPLTPEPTVSESEAAAPATDDQAQQPEGQQPQIDLKYPPSGLQVQCPSCSTPYATPVFTIIDLGADPALKTPLLGGQVNMAQCPSCGAAGMLSAPLMIHVPEEEFLGVYVPQGGGMDNLQSQKLIGDLTQQLMRDLSTEERKGYILQPQQFFDWNRLIEKIWGFEGVTPEMLRRQAEQSNLVQSLMRLANDDSALELAAERNKELIDRDFFTLIEQMAMTMGNQGQAQAAQGLMVLHQKLLGITDAGKEVLAQRERVQTILQKITPESTRSDLLNLMIETWPTDDGEEVVTSIVMSAGRALDYEFLMELAQRIEKAETPEQAESLGEMRDLILEMQAQQKQSQEAMVQQIQAVLQEVLQADDSEAALRQYASAIDENFLGMLSVNIQSAQQNNATAAVQRLTNIYNQAMAIYQEKLPPQVRFLQALMAAPDLAEAKKLLQENRNMLNKELVETMSRLEEQMREAKRDEQADRLKSLRGQVSLML